MMRAVASRCRPLPARPLLLPGLPPDEALGFPALCRGPVERLRCGCTRARRGRAAGRPGVLGRAHSRREATAGLPEGQVVEPAATAPAQAGERRGPLLQGHPGGAGAVPAAPAALAEAHAGTAPEDPSAL